MRTQWHRIVGWLREVKLTKLFIIAANVVALALIVWGFVLREYYPISTQELAAFGSTLFGKVGSYSQLAEIQTEGPIGRTAVYLFFTGYLPALSCGLVVGVCGIPIGKPPPKPRSTWALALAVLLSGALLAVCVSVVFRTGSRELAKTLIGAFGPVWSVFIPYGTGIVVALLLHSIYLLAQASSRKN